MRRQEWRFALGWRGWRESAARGDRLSVLKDGDRTGVSFRVELLSRGGKPAADEHLGRQMLVDMTRPEAAALAKAIGDYLEATK